jgi:spore germination protein GerM
VATTSTTGSTTTTAVVRRVTLVFPRPTSPGYDFVPVEREVPSTAPVEVAALQALLAGPTPAEVSAQKVTNPFAYSQAIRARIVTIANGTASADFLPEVLAYGGGSANVEVIGGSITETLKRFPGVTKVVILVEGQS